MPFWRFALLLNCTVGSPAAASGDVFGIGPIADSSSSEALSLLQGWLTECVLTHEECGKVESRDDFDAVCEPDLPTRVIDVGGLELNALEVRLIESHGARGYYAALSHCWGPVALQPLRTTKSTFRDHLAGIKVSSLPQTFRDAVVVTRHMGLRYIWIDSLCIIQDDRQDWLNEAPRMGPLYSRARLVIAASGARNSREGCFMDRNPPGPSLQVPYITEEGEQVGGVLLRAEQNRTSRSPSFGPLGKRAWVLQEWTLANRIIHFTKDGMMWSCQRLNGAVMCEDGSIERGNATVRDTWDNIIESFTARDITVLTDKLIAVQGLADVMQNSRDDRYINGIWTAELPQQLFWIGNKTSRPFELRPTPSWSWASTHGRCVSWTNRKPRWESIHSSCTIENDNELKIVAKTRECTLKRLGPLVHDMVRKPPFSDASVISIWDLPVFFYQTVVHLILDKDTENTVGMAVLDDSNDLGKDAGLCISSFLMHEASSSQVVDGHVYYALLLNPCSGNPSLFSRIGIGFIVNKAWVKSGDFQSLTVI